MNSPKRKLSRILLTSDTLGGVWTYSIELSRILKAHGIDVVLATMGAEISAQQRADLRGLNNVEVCQSSYKLEWMQDPWKDLAAAGDWLLELEERFQTDLVHLNQYAFGALPWNSPVLLAAHSCVLSWWSAVHNEPAPASWNRYRRVVRNGLRRADAIVSPSEEMRHALLRHYGPLPPVQVIHNGRNHKQFRQGPKKEMLLSVGRIWDAAKNISAVAELAPSLPWPVYVAGDDGIEALNRPNVHKMGKLGQRDLRRLFANAAIYALPAKYEPFGLSVLEAALSGCVLVLGDIPSLRELWNGAAIFVDPVNQCELKGAINLLIGSRLLREKYARAAMKRAVAYSTELMSEQYLRLYAWLLEFEGSRIVFTHRTINGRQQYLTVN